MEQDTLDTAKSLWREISKYTADDRIPLDKEIQKKLPNIFHFGDYYYYIFNCLDAKIEFVSDSMCEILGHQKSYFSVDNLPDLIHPEDFPYFVSYERKVTEFFTQLPPDQVKSYKVSYDYRMRKANGNYVRILHQTTTIQSDENGAVIRVLGVHTDITKLKKECGSTLSFIGLGGHPTYEDVNSENITLGIPHYNLSKREKEVLKHLLQGKTSFQIANLMFISKSTVDRHRKNMLKKTNTKSTAELSVRSIQERWV